MPGFGFEDDELKKLFAEAGEVVKKAKVSPSAEKSQALPREADPSPPAPSISPASPSPPTAAAYAQETATKGDDIPAPTAAARPGPPPTDSSAGGDGLDFQVQPMQRPALSTEGVVRLIGGEQSDAALMGRTTDGATVEIPWGQVRGLSLGRVADRNILAFLFQDTVYYFSDENVSYKGLLRQMAATIAMNWRSLANEIAARSTDRSDAGILAVTGGGGMVPRYLDMTVFLKVVRSR